MGKEFELPDALYSVKNRISLKIKSKYNLELLTPGTMKLHGVKKKRYLKIILWKSASFRCYGNSISLL